MRKTQLIPVIHMLSENQVIRNVSICRANGISQVFLINHRVSGSELLDCAGKIKDLYGLWVGVNLLERRINDAVRSRLTLDGLWCDQTLTPDVAKHRRYQGQLFTGLAFKYQPQPLSLKFACEQARELTDVAVTSGIGTGEAASVEKVLQIREYLGDHPLALASGVTPENVDSYKGVVDYLMVASSFTDIDEMIDEKRLVALLSRV